MLACLPAPLRHRAHLPLRQKHPRLDHTGAADPRPGRPLDLAGRRRLHPTAPGPRARRRPPPALGTTPRPRQAHPRARPQRVSTTPPNPGHTSQCAEIRQTRTRAPQKHPTTTPNPLPSSQESRLTPRPRFNRKLRRCVRGGRTPGRGPACLPRGTAARGARTSRGATSGTVGEFARPATRADDLLDQRLVRPGKAHAVRIRLTGGPGRSPTAATEGSRRWSQWRRRRCRWRQTAAGRPPG
jgi:hypothetical protein